MTEKPTLLAALVGVCLVVVAAFLGSGFLSTFAMEETDGYQLTIVQPVDGNGRIDIKSGNIVLQSGVSVSKNTVLTIVLSPNDGYELDWLKLDGTDYTDTAFSMAQDITVTVAFKKTAALILAEAKADAITQWIAHVGTDYSFAEQEYIDVILTLGQSSINACTTPAEVGIALDTAKSKIDAVPTYESHFATLLVVEIAGLTSGIQAILPDQTLPDAMAAIIQAQAEANLNARHMEILGELGQLRINHWSRVVFEMVK